MSSDHDHGATGSVDDARAEGRAETGTTAADPTPEQIETLRRERNEYYDLLLRKTAEFDNYRRRVERERTEASDRAVADLLRSLLPVLDDLERALRAAASTEGVDAYREGVELIRKQLVDLLRKRGVTALEVVGHDFDPHLHQAVTREVSTTHRDGEVIEDLQKGYLLGERLLRPAMVRVAARE
jgi:molecular chaperone GrpE